MIEEWLIRIAFFVLGGAMVGAYDRLVLYPAAVAFARNRRRE